jgi:hypothetical protein
MLLNSTTLLIILLAPKLSLSMILLLSHALSHRSSLSNHSHNLFSTAMILMILYPYYSMPPATQPHDVDYNEDSMSERKQVTITITTSS